MNIYVGNLPFSADDAQLKQLFGAHGEVKSVAIVTDVRTGRSRGFGFLEMATEEGGLAAISALNGTELGGRPLRVNEAKSHEKKPSGDFGGGGGGGRRRG
ncbi:MAG: RNA-binding protein [Planctomycetota bacterium]